MARCEPVDTINVNPCAFFLETNKENNMMRIDVGCDQPATLDDVLLIRSDTLYAFFDIVLAYNRELSLSCHHDVDIDIMMHCASMSI